MENLTKENFWNEMKEKYPKAMDRFCIWIDKYKEDNNWDNLFNANYSIGAYKSNDGPLVSSSSTMAPKYHDLPTAMQFGIFTEFIHAMAVEDKEEDSTFIDEIKVIIIDALVIF